MKSTGNEESQFESLMRAVEILLQRGGIKRASTFLAQKHPEDVIDVLEHLEEEERIEVFRYLPVDLQAEVLIGIDDEIIEEFLEILSHRDLSQLLGRMDADDAADVLGGLTEEERESVLNLISPLTRRNLEELLKYPEDTAGGLMDPDVVGFQAKARVCDAIEALKKIEPEEELAGTVYVVDENGVFQGRVRVRDMLGADPETTIRDILRNALTVPPEADREEVIRVFQKYDIVSLPVVDESGRVLGIITHDDVLDALQEEATEDIDRLAGLGEVESMFTGPVRAAGRRLPWLFLNLFTVFLAAGVVRLFKGTIESFAYLAVFMPVIAGMGGNSGTQTLAVVVRSIALGDVRLQDVRKMLLRQVGVGLLIGAGVGLASGIIGFLWVGSPVFGLLVFAGHLGNMTIGCVAGLLVPVVLKLLNRDPALASGVFVTSISDVTGYFIFLGLAAVFLKYLI
jgi:magnesium transporter